MYKINLNFLEKAELYELGFLKCQQIGASWNWKMFYIGETSNIIIVVTFH